MLELSVKVININLPVGHKLLEQCRPLYEYSWFIQRIKTYMAAEHNLDKAMTQTIYDCEREGIMVDFVRRYGTEAVNMLYTQFNMDDALAVRYGEGYEDGFENGFSGGFKDGFAGGLKDGAEKGQILKLIQIVSKKLQKGKDIEQIADEVEEDLEIVKQICIAIEGAGTDDIEGIYEKLK